MTSSFASLRTVAGLFRLRPAPAVRRPPAPPTAPGPYPRLVTIR